MFDLTVTYQDGTDEVTAGQREMAEFETQPFGCSSFDALTSRPVVYLRFLAWAALKRQDKLPKKGMPYIAWSETVERVAFADTDEEAERGADPTPRAR